MASATASVLMAQASFWFFGRLFYQGIRSADGHDIRQMTTRAPGGPTSQRCGEQDDADGDSRPADGNPGIGQRIGFEVHGRRNSPEQDTEKDKHRS
jgi:hypothetical protein